MHRISKTHHLGKLTENMNPPLNQDLSTPINLPDFSGLDLDFEIIDAHHHLFDQDEVYYSWLIDEPEKSFSFGEL